METEPKDRFLAFLEGKHDCMLVSAVLEGHDVPLSLQKKFVVKEEERKGKTEDSAIRSITKRHQINKKILLKDEGGVDGVKKTFVHSISKIICTRTLVVFDLDLGTLEKFKEEINLRLLSSKKPKISFEELLEYRIPPHGAYFTGKICFPGLPVQDTCYFVAFDPSLETIIERLWDVDIHKTGDHAKKEKYIKKLLDHCYPLTKGIGASFLDLVPSWKTAKSSSSP